MMRSLWAGVSGLQAHQIAMDVEGNNISNVNTTGFKYSRVSFSDMLSQTAKIATAPQGDLGGKNSLQIGLGTNVSSVNRIFSQGSIQATDKNTDIAVQGDGFFVISDDAGKTFKFTRDGDFKFDALGNFTTNGGLVVQGWSRDATTGTIDATAPIGNIQIEPGQTIQAQPTSSIGLKANLNSGSPNTQTAVTYALSDPYITSTTEMAFNKLYNAGGNLFSMEDGQGITITLTVGATTTSANLTYRTTPTAAASAATTAGSGPEGQFNTIEGLTKEIETLFGAKVDLTINNAGQIEIKSKDLTATTDPMTITTTGYAATLVPPITTNQRFVDTFSTLTGPIQDTIAVASQPILAQKPSEGEDLGILFNAAGNAYDLANGQGLNVSFTPSIITTNTAIVGSPTAVNITAGSILINNIPIDGYISPSGATALVNAQAIKDLINQKTIETGVIADITGPDSAPKIVLTNTNTKDIKNIKLEDKSKGAGIAGYLSSTLVGATNQNIDVNFSMKQFRYTNGVDKQVGWDPSAGVNNQNDGIYYFKTTEDLRVGLQQLARETNPYATVTVNQQGKFVFGNKDGNTDLSIVVSGISDSDPGTVENTLLTQTFSSMAGSLPVGQGSKTTQGLYGAIHSASIDVFDSLGSKHTVKMDFRKYEKTEGAGATWSYKVTVPIPGEITGAIAPNLNILEGGKLQFNANGSLGSASITSITYTANNGSTPDQSINLNFGDIGSFGGVTSFASATATGGISQDGYPGGDLTGIRIDQSGALIGSFTNGRSLALAQVAMAKFANNEGLMSEGGNVFTQSSNSGDPIIGRANTGGRGFIQSSSLEMSNVDLSRSFTNLIIIQRGYQANSKTITTSDQLLNTLLQLKQ